MSTEMRYADVQAFLRKLAGDRLPNHDDKGAFWNKTYEEFIDLKIYGETLIVLHKDPEASALIKALRGVRPFDDAGAYGRMPLNGPYATDKEIEPIALWISNGCPE